MGVLRIVARSALPNLSQKWSGVGFHSRRGLCGRGQKGAIQNGTEGVVMRGSLYIQRIFQYWPIFTDTEPITDILFQNHVSVS